MAMEHCGDLLKELCCTGHGIHYGILAICFGLYPPPPLRKHQENQKNDGQTESRCVDKAVLPQKGGGG
jgi:hypothetical protein